MAAMLDTIRDAFEGSIDFEGQRLAERYTQYIVVGSAVVAFLAGFALQDLRLTLVIFAAGLLLTLVVVVPPWSMYRQNPISWLPPRPEDAASSTSQSSQLGSTTSPSTLADSKKKQ